MRRIDYMRDGVTADELRLVLAKAGLRPRDVVRMKEPGAVDLPLDDDEAVLEALAREPALLERPLAELGDRAVLARPPDKVLALLD